MFVIQDSTKPEGQNFFRRFRGRIEFTSLNQATTYRTYNKAKQAIQNDLWEYYDKETGEILSEEEHERRKELLWSPFFKPLKDLESGLTDKKLIALYGSQEYFVLTVECHRQASEAYNKKFDLRPSSVMQIREVKTVLE